MGRDHPGVFSGWDDAHLLGGARTPFTDLNGALAAVSPIDLGIKAARAALARTGVDPAEIGTVIAGSMAQASFDAYMLPRHVGLYAGVPEQVPAHLVQRICGTGVEVLSQACDAVAHKGIDAVLCVGAESMSRNPVAAYTHRSGFRIGQVEFKDFLWEALLDPSCDTTMGGTAENLASRYAITRAEVDRFAERSFARALKARAEGFFDDEIVAVVAEVFSSPGRKDRAIRLDRKIEAVTQDGHPRATDMATLARIRPAFGGVQTGGNSSAVVDGAAGAVVVSGGWLRRAGRTPLARLIGAVAVGCPPEIMGIGPAPAIRALLERTGLALGQIDRIEINEAFGAQALACVRELGLDEDKLNVNGGAIAIGHPLGATGVRLTLTLARELARRGLRYGIASACIGGGQGIAMLIENGAAAR
jgi:acetyl-CoA C-acetyltransferase